MSKKQTRIGSLSFLIKEAEADKKPVRHPKCKGYYYFTDCGYEFDCDYNTELLCEDCKYGACGGRKDPEAKCNQAR